MRLAGQLLAVSAVTLLLPWAGCQYAREIESALREGEEQALVSTARLLGAALAADTAGPAFDPERWSGRDRALDLYAHPLEQLPTLDGFVEDWGVPAGSMESRDGMAWLVGRRGAFVHVFVQDAGPGTPVSLELAGRRGRLDFPLEAPGPVNAGSRGLPDDPRSRGYWQPTRQGWQLEARVPASLLEGRLGLRLLDANGRERASTFGTAPGWLTGPDPAAQAALESLAPPGQRIHLVDRAGFVLASLGPGAPEQAAAAPGWSDRLYRRLLGEQLDADPAPVARPGQLSGRHLELAALGRSEARRYARPQGTLLAAASPVGPGTRPEMIVVVERETAEIVSLASAPTRRLLATSLLASLGAAAVLLGFAAVLSLRIRRLRDAAGVAVDARGEVRGRLPGATAADELGDLARNIDALLARVREHNLYLQSLGSRLAHELRTPLAVVRSSLDNLEASDDKEGPWLGRAREGVDRMAALVNALSAARQMERAIAAASFERFDLAAQLEDMAEAYRASHSGWRFELQRPAGPCMAEAAPELVAQALDKLVENAVEFAPPGTAIRLSLGAAEARAWRLAVANTGSRLPAGPPERLFDSLVSERAGDAGLHLGLGLYIVRLIAERHGGRVMARNLDGGDGVEFVLELPRAGLGQAAG